MQRSKRSTADLIFAVIAPKEQECYLFETKKGKYSKRSIQKICKVYAERAGIKKNVTPHTLRRTFATHLFEKKEDIYRIQKLMGHSSPNTTAGYINYAYLQV